MGGGQEELERGNNAIFLDSANRAKALAREVLGDDLGGAEIGTQGRTRVGCSASHSLYRYRRQSGETRSHPPSPAHKACGDATFICSC